MSLRAKLAKLERAVARKGPGCRRCWGNRGWGSNEACEHCGYGGLGPVVIEYTPLPVPDWASDQEDGEGG